MNRQCEQWLSVVDWEGYYEVSSQGNVRSVDRVITRSDGQVRHYAGKALAPADNGRGYLYVHLTRGAERQVRLVHQLVAEAFMGHRPDGFAQVVRHGIGGSRDNSVENISLGTRGDNLLDRRAHGTDPNANRTHCIRGHGLSGPNLRTRPGIHATWRSCRACGNAKSYIRYHNITPCRMQEISDGFYREIMESA